MTISLNQRMWLHEDDRKSNWRDQILTAGPWGPTAPGNPLVPGSPWKQKTLGVCKTSEYMCRSSAQSRLQHCLLCASMLSQVDKQVIVIYVRMIQIHHNLLSAHKNAIKRQCCVLTAAPGLPLPYGRHRKAN